MDNFDFGKFLMENKLGAYSKVKVNEAEMDDVIRGMGGDDDYDRKGDAERTGAKFIPHTEPERSPSKFTRPSSQQDLIKKLVNKMRILNRVAIDRYKYAKKEARPAAKEELHKAVKYMLGDSAKYTDEVMKGLLQPIHDEWAKYAQSKATQNKPEGGL